MFSQRLKRAAATSWKTTLAGVIAGLSVIFVALRTVIDGDAATAPDWNYAIPEILAGVGLIVQAIAARDSDVSSEAAQARIPFRR